MIFGVFGSIFCIKYMFLGAFSSPKMIFGNILCPRKFRLSFSGQFLLSFSIPTPFRNQERKEGKKSEEKGKNEEKSEEK
jgi:hypothetical protein